MALCNPFQRSPLPSLVLDFPGNTRAQRAWFREMFERAHVEHELASILVGGSEPWKQQPGDHRPQANRAGPAVMFPLCKVRCVR